MRKILLPRELAKKKPGSLEGIEKVFFKFTKDKVRIACMDLFFGPLRVVNGLGKNGMGKKALPM